MLEADPIEEAGTTPTDVPKNLWLYPLIAILLAHHESAVAYEVRVCTDRGAIDVEIDEQRAPLQAANFLRYVESGFYAGTVIHRAVRGSMIQGGSYDRSLQRRPAGAPVANESGNGLSNQRGTLAASRAADPNSATSQFFFNLADNSHLDGAPGTPGYTVFGRVTGGLQVLDGIASLPTRRVGELEEVPQPLVEIQSVAVIANAGVIATRGATAANPAFGSEASAADASLTALRSEFLAAMSRNDAAGILEAADAFRQNCIELEPSQLVAEAEAAITQGFPERARNRLGDYLSKAGPADRDLSRAMSLYDSLAGDPERTRDIAELTRLCNRPIAPTIPGGRFVEQRSLATLEDAVRRYRAIGQQYLGCLTDRIESGNLTEEETEALIRLHNDTVVEVTGVSMRYNQAVRSFRDSSLPAGR